MSTTTDRRVKYTKMVLRESLIKKLRDKPIARITIKELCEDA
ncbi:MAG TPA: TetR/AcrR family transcriptional regulator, partial [Firmicutes bacterium]|nr:TetR/AcrR family transcriptional regulator [Bacillota bacterium]HBG43752.1 TetR/AcrR family transcriptional regulator [Bacillota bacterium]HCX70765.1 TetR/AcrR family transcriptional regulator [Bacillota bacterium]